MRESPQKNHVQLSSKPRSQNSVNNFNSEQSDILAEKARLGVILDHDVLLKQIDSLM